MLINSEFPHLPCGPFARSGNATFPGPINHAALVIWQSSLNTVLQSVPRAQTHDLIGLHQTWESCRSLACATDRNAQRTLLIQGINCSRKPCLSPRCAGPVEAPFGCVALTGTLDLWCFKECRTLLNWISSLPSATNGLMVSMLSITLDTERPREDGSRVGQNKWCWSLFQVDQIETCCWQL